MKKRILALTLALSLLLTSCGGGTSAATMHLRKTVGTVDVYDSEGKGVEPQENLGLYSGYEVDTQAESYAWIDLDEVKLVKLDEDSKIAITKEDKKLEIEVKSGSLFFNVAEPLADDESMTIRTSTMAVGIQGACGWVVSNGDQGAQVFLLEGTVEARATAAGERVQVNAGEMAQVTGSGKGETAIEVLPFTEEFIAPFVLSELENDTALSAAILEASSLDALTPQDPAQRLRSEYIDIINSHPILDEYTANVYTANGLMYASEGLSYAAIVDLDGNGTDELVLVTQYGPWSLTKLEVYGESLGHTVLYGEADFSKFKEEYGWEDDNYAPNHFYLAEGNGHIYVVVVYGIQYVGDSFVYTIENNELTLAEHTGFDESVSDQYVANWDLTLEQNICPPLPDDVQMKSALSSCLDTYAQPMEYYYAKLVDTDLYALYGDGSFEKYSWNGTGIEHTVLDENIIYATLMDMDRDGSEELICIMNDFSSVAYSWKGTSCERTLLHEETFEYNGLYRDTVTGNIYLGCTEWRLIGAGMKDAYIGLTDRCDYALYVTEIVIENFGDRSYSELTPAEREEADIKIAEAFEKYESDTARYTLIEKIDLSGDRFESFEQLQHTMDEVRQQLMAR